MADTKVSALTAVTALADADELPVNQSGTSKKVSGALLKAYFGDALGNQSTADQALSAGTLAYLTGSNIAVPVGKLRIGTAFKWRVIMTKTGAGTTASVLHMRVGTLGTTGDTAVLTFTTIVGTANADVGVFDITVTCRGPLSASGIFEGVCAVSHDLAATGFINRASNILQVTSGVFDVTTANLIVGLSCTPGTAQVWTVKQVLAEAKNL